VRGRIPWEHYAGLAAAVLWLCLALHGAWVKGPAMDEPAHIGDGLAILRYGDFRMNPEHPPLFKTLAALPVELITPSSMQLERGGRELAPWVDGQQAMWGYYLIYLDRENPRTMLFLHRLVPVLFGLFGGAVAWLWGREFGGRRAGLFACLLLLFYPEYLGHARFVTMDVPALAMSGLISWLGWRYWKQPSGKTLAWFVLAGASGGLVKLPLVAFTAFLGLAMLAVRGWRSFRPRIYTSFPRHFAPSWKSLLLTALLLAFAGYLFQWAGSGFRFSLDSTTLPMEEPHRFLETSNYPDSLFGRALAFSHKSGILPETTIAMLAHSFSIKGRFYFLMGEARLAGWYHYFLVTTLFKTPLIYLLGLGLLIYTFGRKAWRGHPWEKERLFLLLTPYAALLALMAASRLNIGHRHILFIYFPWCVLLAAILAVWSYQKNWRRSAAWAAAAIALAVTLWVHPHHATYFNLLAGGSPKAGWRYVRDSNIDWGQDLPLAIGALKKMGYDKMNLAYFGPGRPQAYGIDDFRFILPSYPLAIAMPPAEPPRPAWPTLVSLHVLDDVRGLYPGRYDREPLRAVNSILIYAPETEAPSSPSSGALSTP